MREQCQGTARALQGHCESHARALMNCSPMPPMPGATGAASLGASTMMHCNTRVRGGWEGRALSRWGRHLAADDAEGEPPCLHITDGASLGAAHVHKSRDSARSHLQAHPRARPLTSAVVSSDATDAASSSAVRTTCTVGGALEEGASEQQHAPAPCSLHLAGGLLPAATCQSITCTPSMRP